MLRLVLLEAWLVWRTTCNTPQNSVPSRHCDLCEANLLICWEINSSSCGFIHFINTTHFYVCSRFLEFSRFRDDGLPNAGFGWLSFTWCSRSRWCLQLSPCILDDILVIFVTWINRINSCQISGIMEFWFLDSPLLLLFFWAAFPILVQASGHMWCERDVVWIFVSLLPDHMYPFGRVSFNLRESCESCRRSWQTSVSVDIPIIINSFFLCNVQICMSCPHYVNTLQWNWEWFFFRHI